LVDLGAKNGTWVNAHRVTDTRRLAAGDEIRIANYTLLFELLPAGTA